MLRSWLMYIATIIALAIFAIMYTKECAVVMFFTAMIVPLAYAILTLFLARKRFQVSFGTEILTMTKDDASHIEVIIQNASEIASGCMIEVCLLIQSGMGQEIKKERKRIAIQRGGNSVVFDYKAQYSGLNEVRINKVRIYSGFSLFCTNLYPQDTLSFLVMPEYKEHAICDSLSFEEREGESERFSAFRPGNDPSELYDIRDYKAGDKLNRIHWKFSAKNHKMMVQDYGFPLACDTAIFTDVTGEKDIDKIELLIEKLYYLVVRFVVENNMFYVVWKDAETGCLVRRMISKEEDVFSLFSAIFRSNMGACETQIEDMYESQFEGEFLTQSVLLCAGRKKIEHEIVRKKLRTNYLELITV